MVVFHGYTVSDDYLRDCMTKSVYCVRCLFLTLCTYQLISRMFCLLGILVSVCIKSWLCFMDTVSVVTISETVVDCITQSVHCVKCIFLTVCMYQLIFRLLC